MKKIIFLFIILSFHNSINTAAQAEQSKVQKLEIIAGAVSVICHSPDPECCTKRFLSNGFNFVSGYPLKLADTCPDHAKAEEFAREGESKQLGTFRQRHYNWQTFATYYDINGNYLGFRHFNERAEPSSPWPQALLDPRIKPKATSVKDRNPPAFGHALVFFNMQCYRLHISKIGDQKNAVETALFQAKKYVDLTDLENQKYTPDHIKTALQEIKKWVEV